MHKRKPAAGKARTGQVGVPAGTGGRWRERFSTVDSVKGSQGEAKSGWQGYGPSFGGNVSRKASDTKPRNAALRMTSSEWWPSHAMLKIRAPIESRSSTGIG